MDINLYPAADPDQPNRMIVLTDAGLTCTGYDTLGDAAEALAALAADLWRAEEEMAGGLADDESREAAKAHRAATLKRCVDSGLHNPTQHRDGKPRWCNTCQLTEGGFDPDELGTLGRTRQDTARLGIKDPRNAPDVGGAVPGAGPRFNPQPR